ncbi:MAG: glycoside hydrolase family 16 protein [Paludibacteraceae bacterium]
MTKKHIILLFISILTSGFTYGQQNTNDTTDWKLVWSDEFDKKGELNPEYWNFENGFVRNNEAQWYQPQNAYCKSGLLIIEARREKKLNPNYDATSKQWQKRREYAEYTSASVNTANKKEFLFGRFEVRARIDTLVGLWPAIWTLGAKGTWPSNGEIDIMECYPIHGISHILANVACGTQKQYVAKWNSKTYPSTYFTKKNKNWVKKYHIWRMDWDKEYVRLYLDDELLNEVSVEEMQNADGTSPFHQPHYILLNLAIGGNRGGDPALTKFPSHYQIDYVRVYQK